MRRRLYSLCLPAFSVGLLLLSFFVYPTTSDRSSNILSAMSFRILSDTVYVADKFVDIECLVYPNVFPRFSVVIGKGENRLAENGVSYDLSPTKYTFKWDAESEESLKFTVRIHHVTWHDRGYYYCGSISNHSSVFLNVTAPLSRVASFSGAVSSLNAKAAASVLQRPANGTRRFPLRLGPSDGLVLTCRVGCAAASSPAPTLSFRALDWTGPASDDTDRDVSAEFPALRPLTFHLMSSYAVVSNASRRVGRCSSGGRELTGDGNMSAVDAQPSMSWQEVALRLNNCSQMGLDGRTRFMCSAGQDWRIVYVNCPVVYRHFPLTHSEIAAVSVGSVLGLALVGLGFYIFRRRPENEGGLRLFKSGDSNSGVRPANV